MIVCEFEYIFYKLQFLDKSNYTECTVCSTGYYNI